METDIVIFHILVLRPLDCYHGPLAGLGRSRFQTPLSPHPVSPLPAIRVVRLGYSAHSDSVVSPLTNPYSKKVQEFKGNSLLILLYVLQAAVSMLKQDYKEGEMTLKSALALAIKVLNKTMDVSKLSAEKGNCCSLLTGSLECEKPLSGSCVHPDMSEFVDAAALRN